MAAYFYAQFNDVTEPYLYHTASYAAKRRH